MELTAKARGKNTGIRHLIVDQDLSRDCLGVAPGGIEVSFKTESLSLSGRFRAVLTLTYEDIELLAAMAAEVDYPQRIALAEAEIERLKALVEREKRYAAKGEE